MTRALLPEGLQSKPRSGVRPGDTLSAAGQSLGRAPTEHPRGWPRRCAFSWALPGAQPFCAVRALTRLVSAPSMVRTRLGAPRCVRLRSGVQDATPISPPGALVPAVGHVRACLPRLIARPTTCSLGARPASRPAAVQTLTLCAVRGHGRMPAGGEGGGADVWQILQRQGPGLLHDPVAHRRTHPGTVGAACVCVRAHACVCV